MLISCHSSWPLSLPFKDRVLICIPELRETIVCKFSAQADYAIANHYCDLNLEPCQVPNVHTLLDDSLTK